MTGSTSAGRRSRGWPSIMARSLRRAGRWPRPMPSSRSILASWPSLEAQVAAIADDIAYDNHDIDDGLRAGLFTLEELLDVPLIASTWDAVRARYPDVGQGRLAAELVRDQIGLMVNDVLDETRRRVGEAWASSGRGRPRCRPRAGRFLGRDGRAGKAAQDLPLRPHVRVRAGARGRRSAPASCCPACSRPIEPIRSCFPTNGGRRRATRFGSCAGSAISSRE